MFKAPVFICAAILSVGGSAASGAIVLTPTSNGQSVVNVNPGQSITVSVNVDALAQDAHDSCVFRVQFSAPGLELTSIAWQLPYETNSALNSSRPPLSALSAVLTASLVEGPGFPAGVVDIELSNVTQPSEVFTFGTLVSLGLRVPLAWSGPGTVDVTIVPDTFALGFDERVASAGSPLTLVIPAPEAACLLLLAGLGWRSRAR